MPKVSIICPVYNARDYIKETIASVQAQDETDWELLLIDDKSTDNSRDIILDIAREDNRVKLICQEKNGGAARARNRGLQEAVGRYIAYIDSDDIWKENRLSSCLKYMEELQWENAGASLSGADKVNIPAFVFTGYEFADNTGKGSGVIVRVPKTLNYRQALGNTTIFTSTVLFDTTIITKDVLEMPLVKSEDTATWWKILKKGHTAYGLDKNLVYYRRGKDTLSSDKKEAIKRIWYLYRKVEGLSLIESGYRFCLYALRAVLRRI